MNESRLFLDRPPAGWKGVLFAFAACAGATAIGLPFRAFLDAENAVVLYLLAIIVTASRYGRLPAVCASLLAVLSYNFFFTQPYYSFNVYDYHDVITLGLLLIGSLLVGAQTSRLREQTRFYRDKERETALLHTMANRLSGAIGIEACLDVLREHFGQAFEARTVIWRMENGALAAFPALPECEALREQQAAAWAFEHQEAAGIGTSTLPGADFHYLPLKEGAAVLAAMPRRAESGFTSRELRRMAAFASLTHSALGRASQAALAEERKLAAESEAMRATLLSAVSHDFRTPLSTIRSVVEGLQMAHGALDEAARQEMLGSAHGEIVRLERIVTNLLDLTQLSSGRVELKRDFYFLPELVGSALEASKALLGDRPVALELPNDLPALWVDGLLIEQVLINLFENSARYSPAGTPLSLLAEKKGEAEVVLFFRDNGPGISAESRKDLFESFHASKPRQREEGSGLGLTICHAVMKAHGGDIAYVAQDRGACFRLVLPSKAEPFLAEEDL